MKLMDEFKKDYENITASDELIEKTQKLLKQNKKPVFSFKRFVAVAASLAVIFVASVNISPEMAYAMNDIPFVSDLVRVVTLGKYEKVEGGTNIKVQTPQIEGLLDQELEDKINEDFKENSEAVIAAFEKDAKKLREEIGDDAHLGIESSYIIKTDTDDILAIDAYILNTVASSSTKHTFYTIDKHTGELLTLEGLFKPESDYVSVLSQYIKGEMERLNNEEGGMFWIGNDGITEGFTQIKPDQNFYINSDNNLVICFDKYEVAAGAQGSPEFVIPNDVVKDILK